MNLLTDAPHIAFFCPVLDVNHHLIGVTTELSANIIILSLPRHFSAESLFPVILKKNDTSSPLTVKLLLSKIKNRPRNDDYDDIVAKIENPEAFKSFFKDCVTDNYEYN